MRWQYLIGHSIHPRGILHFGIQRLTYVYVWNNSSWGLFKYAFDLSNKLTKMTNVCDDTMSSFNTDKSC